MLQTIVNRIAKKHEEFLNVESNFSQEFKKNIYNWFKVALTYTSNAIEGNTLSHLETAQILEKDITIPGKSLTEHLEVINHAQAIDFANELATLKTRQEIEVQDILTMHKFILQKINDVYAGKIRDLPVRIMGSTIPIPNAQKVSALMDLLVTWLHTSKDSTIKIAADAHLKLAFIHPFIDGNGRTARLLMNLILLQDSYPLVFIKAEDRLCYIKAIQQAIKFASANFDQEDFIAQSPSINIKEFHDYYEIIFEAIEFSLDEYLKN